MVGPLWPRTDTQDHTVSSAGDREGWEGSKQLWSHYRHEEIQSAAPLVFPKSVRFILAPSSLLPMSSTDQKFIVPTDCVYK